jgi:hypothetical protein
MAHGSWLQCQVPTGLCVARVASAPAASPHTFHGKLPIIQGRARRLVAFLSLNPPILDPRPSTLSLPPNLLPLPDNPDEPVSFAALPHNSNPRSTYDFMAVFGFVYSASHHSRL